MSAAEEEPIELDAMELDDDLGVDDAGSDAGSSKIQSFARGEHQGYTFKRPVNKTGEGATRIKTFHAKLRVDALEFLDDQVNAWLDQNPEYEVKLVTTTIGVLTGKMKEEAMFMSVWV